MQTSPQAIVSIENNFDCSLLITSDTFNQAPGTGWQILLADIFNSTHVSGLIAPVLQCSISDGVHIVGLCYF